MKHFELQLSFLALVAGLVGLALSLPQAIDANYGQLPMIAVPITAWAVWIGSRHHEPGPMPWPAGVPVNGALAAAAIVATATGAGWLASFAIPAAAISIVSKLWPRLATPRLLLLAFLAPTSYVLDHHFGEALRVSNAALSGWLSAAWDPELGATVKDELSCGPHTILVTPACSGARLAVRMLALAGVLCVLKPLPRNATIGVLVAALGFAAISNVGRIVALCIAAPDYTVAQLPELELYHDASGLASFVVAYLVLGVLIAVLARRRRRDDQPQ